MASVQTSTSGNLQNMSRIMLTSARYTEEHNAPMVGLIEKFNLKKGEYQLTIPKVGQMDAEDLVEGRDMIDSEDIDVSTVTATTAEVGLKVIITDTSSSRTTKMCSRSLVARWVKQWRAKRTQTSLLCFQP